MATPDYGRDISCDVDMDSLGRDISGADMMRQVALRRLTTRKGTLFSAPNAISLDLRDFLSAELSASDAPKIQSQARAALLDDERIASADITVTVDTKLRTLTLVGKCTGALGPFSFTLAVSAVKVQLLT